MNEPGQEPPEERPAFVTEPDNEGRGPSGQRGMNRLTEPPFHTQDDLLVIEEGGLSGEQQRVLADLRRLYHSLCGPIAGQYWPQALLDSAGRFNRPAFPPRPPRRDSDA